MCPRNTEGQRAKGGGGGKAGSGQISGQGGAAGVGARTRCELTSLS